MSATIEQRLQQIADQGNLRRLPGGDAARGCVDFSANDYLGLTQRRHLQREFLQSLDYDSQWLMGASASRLLASRQNVFNRLEATLEAAYGDGRRALVFNSGYHANTGIVSALADKDTAIIADRLVHASIIDGLKLGGASFERFRHNDMAHLERLMTKASAEGRRPLVIVESVYSMDGDSADIEALVKLKKQYGAMLYVDEAHAVGVCGPRGLGLAADYGADIDITVGTFGKALASAGAYTMCSEPIRNWLINRARSFIFSTALPPLTVLWNDFIFTRMQTMDEARRHIRLLGRRLRQALGNDSESHIQPFMVGDPTEAVALSQRLRRDGLMVLPIRRPTVPPGTDRLRISLSAAMTYDDIDKLAAALQAAAQ